MTRFLQGFQWIQRETQKIRQRACGPIGHKQGKAQIIMIGVDDVGDDNVGDDNVGDDNVGDDDLGDDDVGDDDDDQTL